jgi:serine/threonine protein kinase
MIGKTVSHHKCILVYEMLTGQSPFKGNYDQAVTNSILNEEPAPVSGLLMVVPIPVEQIVKRELEKDVEERH